MSISEGTLSRNIEFAQIFIKHITDTKSDSLLLILRQEEKPQLEVYYVFVGDQRVAKASKLCNIHKGLVMTGKPLVTH